LNACFFAEDVCLVVCGLRVKVDSNEVFEWTRLSMVKSTFMLYFVLMTVLRLFLEFILYMNHFSHFG
jgi:hypothetical protein